MAALLKKGHGKQNRLIIKNDCVKQNVSFFHDNSFILLKNQTILLAIISWFVFTLLRSVLL